MYDSSGLSRSPLPQFVLLTHNSGVASVVLSDLVQGFTSVSGVWVVDVFFPPSGR